jgi:uncharacterized protein YndB with AHSA1/START domain
VLVLYRFVSRPWHLRWGATDEEARRSMPGDDLIPNPDITFTRAITINTPPKAVWPWLVQMGYRRAGWYSYDRFDNDGIHVRRIIPEFQALKVGDIMLTDSGGGFRVEAIEPEQSLVLKIDRASVGQDLELSCVITLEPLDGHRTRLILRVHGKFNGPVEKLWGRLLFDAGDFVMMRKMLLGIKERAEQMT